MIVSARKMSLRIGSAGGGLRLGIGQPVTRICLITAFKWHRIQSLKIGQLLPLKTFSSQSVSAFRTPRASQILRFSARLIFPFSYRFDFSLCVPFISTVDIATFIDHRHCRIYRSQALPPLSVGGIAGFGTHYQRILYHNFSV